MLLLHAHKEAGGWDIFRRPRAAHAPQAGGWDDEGLDLTLLPVLGVDNSLGLQGHAGVCVGGVCEEEDDLADLDLDPELQVRACLPATACYCQGQVGLCVGGVSEVEDDLAVLDLDQSCR